MNLQYIEIISLGILATVVLIKFSGFAGNWVSYWFDKKFLGHDREHDLDRLIREKEAELKEKWSPKPGALALDGKPKLRACLAQEIYREKNLEGNLDPLIQELFQNLQWGAQLEKPFMDLLSLEGLKFSYPQISVLIKNFLNEASFWKADNLDLPTSARDFGWQFFAYFLREEIFFGGRELDIGFEGEKFRSEQVCFFAAQKLPDLFESLLIAAECSRPRLAGAWRNQHPSKKQGLNRFLTLEWKSADAIKEFLKQLKNDERWDQLSFEELKPPAENRKEFYLSLLQVQAGRREGKLIKKAYLNLAQVWHPDKISLDHYPPRLQEILKKRIHDRYVLLNQGFEYLQEN